MATHFEGRFEVEFKYRLADRAAFLAALASLDPEVMLEDNQERDCYFDSPARTLAAEGKSLVIRAMAPSGIRLWILKGPGPDRCEAVNISDDGKAISMLHNLGYEEVLVIEKRRSIYFLGPFHLTLDHLTGIGDFAELAIMTDDENKLEEYKHQLLSLAKELGLQEREHRSYRKISEMYHASTSIER